ncbi:MAG: hypothetical protein K2H23_00930 [Oscillospiraceae bacterium]|nr:hypothetical protein [Oscillospiraceae bacterium]
MTKIERKRAKLLENTTHTCNSSISKINVLMILGTVLMLIADAAVFCLMLEDNELYVVVDLHLSLMHMVSTAFVFVSSTQIGDKSIITDIGNRNFGGSYYQGKFLASLPFEAKDVLNMRLRHCEIQLFTATAATAAMIAAVTAAGGFGYHEYRGIVGMTVLFFPLLEIVLTISVLLSKHWYIGMIVTMFMSLLPLFSLIGCADETGETSVELALQFNERLKGFEFMSGISGIIMLILISAVIYAGAELIVKNIRNYSWKLK